MTSTTMQIPTMATPLVASRMSDRVRPSATLAPISWSIAAVASAQKPCTHRVYQGFGTNATDHPRPEEAPL